MANQCVVAIYKTFDKLQEGVKLLDQANVPSSTVSLATHSLPKNLSREKAIQAGDNTEQDAAIGAGVGGLLGILLGAPVLMIPGIGPLLLAGPIATGMTGAIVGGLLGSMAGWGVHDDHVAAYEQKLREGNLLLMVTGNPADVDLAYAELQKTETEELQLHTLTSADSPEIVEE